MDENKMTPKEYLNEKLKEKGIWTPMLEGLDRYANILDFVGDDPILLFGWDDPNKLTDEVKYKIDKKIEEIEVSNDGKKLVIRNNGENEKSEVTISSEQDNVELVERNAKVSVEKNENDSYRVTKSASTKRMYLNVNDKKIRYLDSSDFEMPVDLTSEPILGEPFISPEFFEEQNKYGNDLNVFKKSMAVSNRKINFVGEDEKLKVVDLTQKIAEKILSTFNRSDKSAVKALEEELGKQENVQSQTQEEIEKDDDEER